MLGPREILGLSSQLLPVMQWRTFYPRVRPLAAAGCGEPCLGKSCLLYAKQTATAGPRLVFVVLEFGQSKDFSFFSPSATLSIIYCIFVHSGMEKSLYLPFYDCRRIAF